MTIYRWLKANKKQYKNQDIHNIADLSERGFNRNIIARKLDLQIIDADVVRKKLISLEYIEGNSTSHLEEKYHVYNRTISKYLKEMNINVLKDIDMTKLLNRLDKKNGLYLNCII